MIDIRDLCRECRDGRKIEHFDLKLKNGAVYGILDVCGGYGSALLALMAGVVLPDSGAVRMNGFDTAKDGESARMSVGYVPADMTPYDVLTPEEFFTFVADAKGLDYELTARTVQKALDAAELREKRGRLCENLTKLEKRRLCMVQAELGDPEFVLLDEPLQGINEKDARDIVLRLFSLGDRRTVIISSASYSLLSEVCDEIVILDEGRLVDVLEANDPAAEAHYRTLCEVHGVVAEEELDAMARRRRQRRNRRTAEGAKAEESRG